jgi:ElaA protein
MEWRLKAFDQLHPHELYALLALRSAVFVVEQNCPYADPDTKDRVSYHLWASDAHESLVAVARVVPPEISYPEPSIGRVATAIAHRRTGLGRELMRRAMAQAEALYPGRDLVISAQAYLKRFYEELGFRPEGGEYDEDGIPHVQMRKTST